MIKRAKARTISRIAILAFKITATVAAVWLIARRVDFSEMGGSLARAHAGWLALCIVLQLAITGLNALRWKVLVQAREISFRKYLYYVFVGHYLNVFMPSSALAEGVRTYAFGRRYGEVQKNVVAAVLARASGLLVSLVLGIVACVLHWDTVKAFMENSGLSIDLRLLWIGLAALLAAIVLAGAVFRKRLQTVRGILRDYSQNRRPIYQALWVSLAIQIGVIVSSYALYRSVQAEIQIWHMAVIPALVQLVLLLPVSLGGVGVREFLSIHLLAGLAGVPREVSLAGGILGYVPWLMQAAIGWAWMFSRRYSKQDPWASSGGEENAD